MVMSRRLVSGIGFREKISSMAFTGEIAEIPVGILGLTGTKNMSQVRPEELIEALNITYEDGTVKKEGGSAKYNSTAISGGPAILGGWDWKPSSGTQRVIVLLSDGTLKKDTGGGDFSVTLKSGLTVSDVIPVFVETGQEAVTDDKTLFMMTGKNVVQVLTADGATTSDIATPPADWSGGNQPSFGVMHENRFWGGGNANSPHRIYYSLVTDHEDISGGTIQVYPGEGEKLIGAVSFKGVLICWKYPRGIYLIDTSDADTSKWRVLKHSTSVGGVSPLGHILIDDDVVFMDSGGRLQLISAITEFGFIGSRSLSDVAKITPLLLENMTLGELPRVQAIYYPAKAEAHFCLSPSGTDYNRRLVLDFSTVGIVKFRLSDKDTNRSIWLREDSDGVPRPATGDNSGFAWNLDQSNRSKDGAGYNGQFQTAHMDLSHIDPVLGTIRKNGKFLELVVEPKGNFDLNVDILWDDVLTDTVTFNMGESGSTLGSFVLGTDKLAGANVISARRRIKGSGRRISLIGRNSADGEDFSIARMFLGFTRSNDRV